MPEGPLPRRVLGGGIPYVRRVTRRVRKGVAVRIDHPGHGVSSTLPHALPPYVGHHGEFQKEGGP